MEKSKVETLVGFAMRAGKVKVGVGSIEKVKSLPLMIMCGTAAKNTIEKVKSLKRRYESTVIISKDITLEEIVHKKNAKVIGITDSMFSKGILENLDSHYTLMVEA